MIITVTSLVILGGFIALFAGQSTLSRNTQTRTMEEVSPFHGVAGFGVMSVCCEGLSLTPTFLQLVFVMHRNVLSGSDQWTGTTF